MSAPQRLPTPGRRPRPQVSPGHGYSEDQENWSDDPSNGQNEPETPRPRTRRHVLPNRRSSFMPGGETVPYNYPTPRRRDGEPFASGPGPGPWPYTGHFGMPPPTQPPYTPDQQYPSPGGGFPQGSVYCSTGKYGTGYTQAASQPQPSPYPQRPYYPSMSTEQPHSVYAPPYQAPAPPQFSPPFTNGRTGIRRPSIRVRESQHEGAERDKEADVKRRRERNRQRERERMEAEKEREQEEKKRERERECERKEAEKKEREREKERKRERESDRIQRGKLKLKVQKLQRQLQLERRKTPGPGASESFVQDLIDRLHDQREQENQRRWIERSADPFARLLQCFIEYADARRVCPYQQDRLQWPGGFSPNSRQPTRSDSGDVRYDAVQRSQIEEVVMDVINRWTAGDKQEKFHMPLPSASQSTARGVREDPHPDDRSPRGPPSEWQEEEGGAAPPRSRFVGGAPANISDTYRGPSSPRYRSGDIPGTAPSTPKLEKRQTTPPANIKVPISGSSKRARGSDLSSEYSSAADRRSFPIHESHEALRQRTKPGRRSSQSGPQPAQGLEIPRVRHGSRHGAGHTAGFKNQAPAGDRPIADIGRDGSSGSDTEDGARGRRQTRRPYLFTGEKVQGRRYNPRDARELTPPPEVPEVPRTEVGERAWRAAGGPGRDPRRVARVDSWSDDGEEERWSVARPPSAMGR